MSEPLKKPTIYDVVDIISNMGYGREAVKIMVKDEDEPGEKKPILSPDALSLARRKYYEDVPNMSLATLRREQNLDFIPQMTIQQLRELSDDLYLTMDPNELVNRGKNILLDPNFPEKIKDTEDEIYGNLAKAFFILWEKGGDENKPTTLFDEIFPLNILERYAHHYDVWRENNERKYFEAIYRALITPMNGGKRTRRTPRRKSKKSRKTKRKTKRRRT